MYCTSPTEHPSESGDRIDPPNYTVDFLRHSSMSKRTALRVGGSRGRDTETPSDCFSPPSSVSHLTSLTPTHAESLVPRAKVGVLEHMHDPICHSNMCFRAVDT